MNVGAFTFVLHSHLPYVRMAGRWPHGEEMLHEALAETYLPLLDALYDLKAGGVEARLTMGLTPILVEQLADADVLDHFELYVEERIEAARLDVERFQRESQGHLAYLARFYHEGYEQILASFLNRYRRDVVGAFRGLLEAGNLDLLTSAATHAYLPLLDRDSSIYAQLKVGVETYRRFFGRAPRGIWLPECGYRPAHWKENGQATYKAGIEEFLAELNLHYFFTETHVIEGGQLVGKAAGDVQGPYGALPVRSLVQKADERLAATRGTTFQPYYVTATNVAVLGRDERTGLQVWSASQGYPGDFTYREFHRKDPVSGFQYWRITDPGGDLGRKALYDPYEAFRQASAHAEHFVQVVRERLAGYRAAEGRPGIVVSAYDTELFGHWWFEGVAWLKGVLQRLATSEAIELTTADRYLLEHPPEAVLTLPESSWGAGGGHDTWLNEETRWMWPLIHNAELQLERLAARYPVCGGELRLVLDQAARELLLLEASDWPFLVSTGQARDYATSRFQQHLARFNHLIGFGERGGLLESDRHFLQIVQECDRPFRDIDYRAFANREGWLAP